MIFFHTVFVFSFFPLAFAQVSASWETSPLNPPSLPLAIKGPYLNSWITQGANPSTVPRSQPNFWLTTMALGWFAAARVDGQPYTLFGNPANLESFTVANQSAVIFTPTRTSFLLDTGTVEVNMTFLSPIEPSDLTRLSIPFVYLYLTVASKDGNAHDVQIYSDLDGGWIAGDPNLPAQWSMTDAKEFLYLQIELQDNVQQSYIEEKSVAKDAALFHCILNRTGLSWEINPAPGVRIAFGNGTGLQNRSDTQFHALNQPWDNLGFSVDLGNITPEAESEAVVFGVGVLRDPVVQYTDKDLINEGRSAYYRSSFSTSHDIINDTLTHFNDALEASIDLDNALTSAARNISEEYSSLISLITRQALGSIEYTIKSSDLNVSDVKAFMDIMGTKEGNAVNTVDIIYASMPIYLYLNPSILGYLLSPLLEYQEGSQYTNSYAAVDLGSQFPKANGTPAAHNQKIEQSANMIIMSLAHAQKSGDGSILDKHYGLLSGWGSYLVNNTMLADSQTTSQFDTINGKNQTNLVLKGIIAIRAMSVIASLTGHGDESEKLKAISTQYYQSWEISSTGPNGLLMNLNRISTSSGLIYNLYADKLLQLGLVNDSVYDLQTSYYDQSISGTYGIPLDSSYDNTTRIDWMMFSAAAVSDTKVRDKMISQVYAYASSGKNMFSLTPIYNSWSGIGDYTTIRAPSQGGIFAPLALTKPNKQILIPNSASTQVQKRSHAGVIAGSVIAGVIALLSSVAGFAFIRRYRSHRNFPSETPTPRPFIYESAASDTSRTNRSSIVNRQNISQSKTRLRALVSTSSSSGQDENLRVEVENLRREIEQMREGRSEALPPYPEILGT